MGRIALISAMHEELSAVLARLPDEQKTTVAGRDFWLGHWHGHEVVAVLSRIGKVAEQQRRPPSSSVLVWTASSSLGWLEDWRRKYK